MAARKIPILIANRCTNSQEIWNESGQYQPCQADHEHDANGNLTADGDHTYHYGPRNRLQTVDNGATARYRYNAEGQRVFKWAELPSLATPDLNFDGQVSEADLHALREAIRTEPSPIWADLNGDGAVNGQDTPCIATRIGDHKSQGQGSGRKKGKHGNQGNRPGHAKGPHTCFPETVPQQRLFSYDQWRLLGEYTRNGRAVQETVWLGNLLIATVRHGTIHHVHTDHLGTPRRISESGSGEVVWKWASDPFGRAQAAQDPDGDGREFRYNLRFPGQYHDFETGKHYNYFRDYEPGIGRYIQADPIGLDGGLNNFKYARQNPAGFADPYGQNPLCIPLVAGDGPLPVGDVACGVLIIGSIYAGANAVKDTSEALDGNSCEPDEADCEEEWEDAFEVCQEQIERGEARGVTGGYDNLYQCAKGLVSERCGGNRVE